MLSSLVPARGSKGVEVAETALVLPLLLWEEGLRGAVLAYSFRSMVFDSLLRVSPGHG